MSAVVYAPYADASAFYRLLEPARVLGVPVVEHLPQVGDAETVILNRPFDGGIAEQIRLWVAEGRRVIVDQDDCFDTVSPNHAVYGRYTTEHMHLACKYATVVTTSTPALARRYGYGHGTVLRNRVPAWRLDVRRDARGPEAPLWVGWYGSLWSHPDDPAQVGGGLGAPMRDTGAEFAMFGPEKDVPIVAGHLGHDGVTHPFGYYSMDGVMRAIAEWDLGIVPLELSAFNEAKSGLKGMELAAAGVAVIASPTSEYKRMAEFGACVTAKTPRDWANWGRLLLRDAEARRAQAARGKAWAATQTYEAHAADWRAVWFD